MSKHERTYRKLYTQIARAASDPSRFNSKFWDNWSNLCDAESDALRRAADDNMVRLRGFPLTAEELAA